MIKIVLFNRQTNSIVDQVDVKRAVPKDQPQERCHKIFVGGLPETNEAELKAFFEKHGKVTQCQFKRDQNTGRGRGFGFVSFEDSDTVDKLVILKVCLVQFKIDSSIFS